MTERSSTLIDEGAYSAPVYTVEVGGISEELLRRLDAQARKRGSDRSQVIREIITRELGAEEPEITGQSFDTVLAPMRAGFAETELSEEEAEALLDDGLRAVRAERRQTRLREKCEAQRVTDDR